MHELGVMIEVIKTVEKFAFENQVTQIEELVLQIGELSSMIPHYIEACYPAAIDGTILENARLKIEIIPGNALCQKCRNIFNALASKGSCPDCGGKDLEILSGREFMIKEIKAC